MLSFLRKHQYGFMLVVAIVVIIAFTFFYDRNDRGGNPRTQKVFELYGKDYTLGDVERFKSTFQLAQRLGMYEFLGALFGERVDGSPQDFIYNLIVLRKEAGKLGIHASQQEIEAKIREMPAFSPGGSFDQAAFDNLKANLGSFGFTAEDLYQLIGDDVALTRLRDLLSASFKPTSLEIEDAVSEKHAKVSAYRVDFPAEKYAENVEVTDEEIATYFDEHKSEFRSEPKRAIEYIHFTQPDFTTAAVVTPPTPEVAPEATPAPEETAPEAVPTPVESTPEVAPEATPEEETAPVEEESAAEEEEESSSGCQGAETETETEVVEEPAAEAPSDPAPDATPVETPEAPAAGTPDGVTLETPLDLGSLAPGVQGDALDQSANLLDDPAVTTPTLPTGPTPEERKAVNDEYNRDIDAFIVSASASGADFKALAESTAAALSGKKYQAKYGSTEPFSQAEPAEAIKDQPGLIRAVFTHPATKPISNPVRTANGFWIFRVTAEEAPKDLTLEEASAKIRETLTKEKQAEAVKKAAEEAREKIKAEMKEGVTFADAAKAAGYEATRIAGFVGSAGPTDTPDFYTHLREPINETAAGQISEPHVVEQSAVLVYVASRVVPEDQATEANRKTVADQLVTQQYSSTSYSALMFKAWLDQARKDADVPTDDLGLGKPVF